MPHRLECPARAASHAIKAAVLLLEMVILEERSLVAEARLQLDEAQKWLNSASRPPHSG
jgi:hypothetical protein